MTKMPEGLHPKEALLMSIITTANLGLLNELDPPTMRRALEQIRTMARQDLAKHGAPPEQQPQPGQVYRPTNHRAAQISGCIYHCYSTVRAGIVPVS